MNMGRDVSPWPWPGLKDQKERPWPWPWALRPGLGLRSQVLGLVGHGLGLGPWP